MELYITIIVTLILSAFCSSMEIAFLGSNKLRLEVEKSESGLTDRIVDIFCKHPQQYITTLLVGNNIVLVIFSMKMNELLTPWFAFMKHGGLISLVVTLIATIVVLFLGEYLPKNISRNNPNLLLRVFSPFTFIIYIVLYPVAIFCTFCAKVLMRLFGIKTPEDKADITFTRADLDYLVEELDSATDNPSEEDTEEEERPSENEIQILKNALEFSQVKVRDCYVPRTEVVAMPWESTAAELKQVFQETGFSKLPIYKEDIDNIVGYLHCSEMFEHQDTWQQHINSIPFVPENMLAQKLMRTFMQEKKSIAVVIDEFGGTAGIVTLEDIMEEIFGEIEDEHDTTAYVANRLNEHEILVSGRLEVEEVNERFDLDLPEDDAYDTIAGLILHETGNFPKLNEHISIGKYDFQCLKITANRILLVKITL